MGTLTSKDGTRLAFERWGAGPAVILVVGAFNARATGAPLAHSLADHFSVFNYDRRGRGESGDSPAYAIEHFGRLDRDCLTLLEAASVQGEVFNAGVLAQVLDVAEGAITTRLSGPLCKRQRLVESLGLVKQNGTCQAQYRFRNLLFQKYLYLGLDEVERARLQRAIDNATVEGPSTNGVLRTRPRMHE